MADNTVLNTGTGGDTVRDKDRAGVKTQIMALDLNPAGAETLMAGAMPILGAQQAATSGSIGAIGNTVSASVTNYTNATVTVSGTHAGINLTFEVSDDGGTTWFAYPFQRESDGVVVLTTGVLTSNSSTIYSASMPGVTNVRVRATAWTSGGTNSVRITPGSMPLEPIVSVGNIAQPAALSDADPNPTTPTLASAGMVWNGTTWTRLRGGFGDAAPATGMQNVVPMGYNGATYDRLRIKAASTAAVAADLALVVALSPNNNTIANALYTRPRQVAAYSAGYRQTVGTAGSTHLGFTFAANTDKQLATIHHLVGSTKTARIKKISVMPTIMNASVYQFEVRRLSAATAPATGNPVITPAAYDTSDAAAEAVCLALPTTAGSEAANNSPLSPAATVNAGAGTGATNPLGFAGAEVVLFDSRPGMGVGKDITLRAGVAEGLAIVGRSSAAVAVTFVVFIEFTEE